MKDSSIDLQGSTNNVIFAAGKMIRNTASMVVSVILLIFLYINVDLVKITIYGICGLLVSIGGLIVMGCL